jgi:hypothetical protein
MDAKVVRITMIPKAFTQGKKGACPVYRAGLLVDILFLPLYITQLDM